VSPSIVTIMRAIALVAVRSEAAATDRGRRRRSRTRRSPDAERLPAAPVAKRCEISGMTTAPEPDRAGRQGEFERRRLAFEHRGPVVAFGAGGGGDLAGVDRAEGAPAAAALEAHHEARRGTVDDEARAQRDGAGGRQGKLRRARSIGGRPPGQIGERRLRIGRRKRLRESTTSARRLYRCRRWRWASRIALRVAACGRPPQRRVMAAAGGGSRRAAAAAAGCPGARGAGGTDVCAKAVAAMPPPRERREPGVRHPAAPAGASRPSNAYAKSGPPAPPLIDLS
jgi:hypothetical protein